MPETMYRLYTVNASFFVKSMYQACTSFLHPRTTQKIKVAGYDKESIMRDITEKVDPSNIPDFLGGNMTSFKSP